MNHTYSDEELDALVRHKPVITWPVLGVTMQQAADALLAMAGATSSLCPDPLGDSSDSIKPCGYEEL